MDAILVAVGSAALNQAIQDVNAQLTEGRSVVPEVDNHTSWRSARRSGQRAGPVADTLPPVQKCPQRRVR